MATHSIEGLYQAIGEEAVSTAGRELGGRLLLYAEVQKDAVSADVLYATRSGEVQLVLGEDRLVDLVYELWEQWQKEPGNQAWQVMTYLVEPNGRLTIDLAYPDDLDQGEDVIDRRPRAIRKFFGNAKVNQPNPFD